jgi:hypothetical protein
VVYPFMLSPGSDRLPSRKPELWSPNNLASPFQSLTRTAASAGLVERCTSFETESFGHHMTGRATLLTIPASFR